MTKFLPFIALIFLGLNVQAQDAKAKTILDDLSNKTRKYPSITSEFTFILDDKVADLHQEQKGTLKMQGKQYYIQLGDNHIYSDGDTRWTYSADMNEVYIDDVDTDDDALDPTDIYTIWETGFKNYYDGEIKENGKTYDVIKLIPTDPADKAFHTVKLYVDRAKSEVAKIEILGKQGNDYTYRVNSFTTDKNYPASTFAFNKANYPGVSTIDNR